MMSTNRLLICCKVSLFVRRALTSCGDASMNFFGRTALQILCSKRAHFAISEPLCGVPRKRMPKVDTYTERRCSVFSFERLREYMRARFTTRPPREWHTKIIG